ncbi:hypothetical protein HDV05_002759, partial [Chytridiales sp. JEL 0842]
EKEKVRDLKLRLLTRVTLMLLQKVAPLKFIAALGRDASQALGIKGNNKTVQVDGVAVHVASLYHPGKILYDISTFTKWCRKHGQAGSLQQLPPRYQDASRCVINDYVVRNLPLSLCRLVSSLDPKFQLDYYLGMIALDGFGKTIQFGLEASYGTAWSKRMPLFYFGEDNRRLPYKHGFGGRMRTRAEAALIMDRAGVADVVNSIKQYSPAEPKEKSAVKFRALVDKDFSAAFNEALPLYLPTHLYLKGLNAAIARLGTKTRARSKADNAVLKHTGIDAASKVIADVKGGGSKMKVGMIWLLRKEGSQSKSVGNVVEVRVLMEVCEERNLEGILVPRLIHILPTFRHLAGDTVFNFSQRASAWRYLVREVFAGDSVVVACFENGKMYYVPGVDSISDLIPSRCADELFGSLNRNNDDDVDKAKMLGCGWVKSQSVTTLSNPIRLGSIYNGGHLCAPFVQHVLDRKLNLPPYVSSILFESLVNGQRCDKWKPAANPPESHHLVDPSLHHTLAKSTHLTFCGQLKKCPLSTDGDSSGAVLLIANRVEIRLDGVVQRGFNRNVDFRLKKDEDRFLVEIIRHDRNKVVPSDSTSPTNLIVSNNPFDVLSEDFKEVDGPTVSSGTDFVVPLDDRFEEEVVEDVEVQDVKVNPTFDVENDFLRPAAGVIGAYLKLETSHALRSRGESMVEEGERLLRKVLDEAGDLLRQSRFLGIEDVMERPPNVKPDQWVQWIGDDDSGIHGLSIVDQRTRGYSVQSVLPGLSRNDVEKITCHEYFTNRPAKATLHVSQSYSALKEQLVASSSPQKEPDFKRLAVAVSTIFFIGRCLLALLTGLSFELDIMAFQLGSTKEEVDTITAFGSPDTLTGPKGPERLKLLSNLFLTLLEGHPRKADFGLHVLRLCTVKISSLTPLAVLAVLLASDDLDNDGSEIGIELQAFRSKPTIVDGRSEMTAQDGDKLRLYVANLVARRVFLLGPDHEYVKFAKGKSGKNFASTLHAKLLKERKDMEKKSVSTSTQHDPPRPGAVPSRSRSSGGDTLPDYQVSYDVSCDAGRRENAALFAAHAIKTHFGLSTVAPQLESPTAYTTGTLRMTKPGLSNDARYCQLDASTPSSTLPPTPQPVTVAQAMLDIFLNYQQRPKDSVVIGGCKCKVDGYESFLLLVDMVATYIHRGPLSRRSVARVCQSLVPVAWFFTKPTTKLEAGEVQKKSLDEVDLAFLGRLQKDVVLKLSKKSDTNLMKVLLGGADVADGCFNVATTACQRASYAVDSIVDEHNRKKQKLSFFGLVQELSPRRLATDRNGNFWDYAKGELSSKYTASGFLRACPVFVVLELVGQPCVYVRVKRNGRVTEWLELAYTPFGNLAESVPAANSEMSRATHHKATITDVKVCVKTSKISREWTFHLLKPLVLAVSDHLLRNFKLSFAQMISVQVKNADFADFDVHLPMTVQRHATLKKRSTKMYLYSKEPLVTVTAAPGEGGTTQGEGGGEHPTQGESVVEAEEEGASQVGGGGGGGGGGPTTIAATSGHHRADFVIKKLILVIARLTSIPLSQADDHFDTSARKSKAYLYQLEQTLVTRRRNFEGQQAQQPEAMRIKRCWANRQTRNIADFLKVCRVALASNYVRFKYVEGRDGCSLKTFRGGMYVMVKRNAAFDVVSSEFQPIVAHDEGISVMSTVVASNGDVFSCGPQVGHDLANLQQQKALYQEIWANPDIDVQNPKFQQLNGKTRFGVQLFLKDVHPLRKQERKDLVELLCELEVAESQLAVLMSTRRSAAGGVEVGLGVERLVEEEVDEVGGDGMEVDEGDGDGMEVDEGGGGGMEVDEEGEARRSVEELKARIQQLQSSLANDPMYKRRVDEITEVMSTMAVELRKRTSQLLSSFKLVASPQFDMTGAAKKKKGPKMGLPGITKTAGLTLAHSKCRKMIEQQIAHHNMSPANKTDPHKLVYISEECSTMMCPHCRFTAPRDEKGGVLAGLDLDQPTHHRVLVPLHPPIPVPPGGHKEESARPRRRLPIPRHYNEKESGKTLFLPLW